MDKKTKISIGVIVGIICIILIGAVVISFVQKGGATLRATAGIESDNLQIDNAMLSYYMYDYMYDKVGANPHLYEERGFDMDKPLKKQMFNETMTWYDYFMEMTVKEAKNILIFAEKAYDEGVGLEEKDFLKIDREINKLNAEAKNVGMSEADYIQSRYGEGVQEDDIRRALEVYYISTKVNDDLLNSFEYSEEEINTYYQNFRQYFLYTDCIFFSTIPTTVEDEDATEKEIEEARAKAKADAEALIACNSEEEFMANLKTYIFDNYDAEIAEEKYAAVLHENYKFVSDNKLSDWLFSDTREDGDKTVITFNDDRYTAVYVVDAAERDDSMTKNVIDVYLDAVNYENDEACMSAAEAILAEYEAGTKSAEEFKTLATEKGEDEALAAAEGAVNNVSAKDDVVYAAWANESGRKTGDTTILADEDGVHILYFVGKGVYSWQNDTEKYMRAADYVESLAELEEEFPVTVSLVKCNQVRERS
ncbi:MAG: hypothetical protein IKM13_09245 [Clostridia bacterium]|nr:hypothetical protein [Clostridia bacterium]